MGVLGEPATLLLRITTARPGEEVFMGRLPVTMRGIVVRFRVVTSLLPMTMSCPQGEVGERTTTWVNYCYINTERYGGWRRQATPSYRLREALWLIILLIYRASAPP